MKFSPMYLVAIAMTSGLLSAPTHAQSDAMPKPAGKAGEAVPTAESLKGTEQVVNPFTGKPLTEEGLKRHLAVMQVQTAIAAEQLKQQQLSGELKLTNARSDFEQGKINKELRLIKISSEQPAAPAGRVPASTQRPISSTPVPNRLIAPLGQPSSAAELPERTASIQAAPATKVSLRIGGEEIHAPKVQIPVATVAVIDSQAAKTTKPPTTLPTPTAPPATTSANPGGGVASGPPITLIPNPTFGR
jgi:hypothetical protein